MSQNSQVKGQPRENCIPMVKYWSNLRRSQRGFGVVVTSALNLAPS